MTEEQLLALMDARPVRDHILVVRVLDGYHGDVAYYDRGLVISGAQWELVKSFATIHAADIGLRVNLQSVPVEIVDEGPEHSRLMTAWRSGLFAKVVNGEVER